ncbi:hypothetical protein BDQ12DRAFT_674505 [Crucibulum laeve]|uniref:Uncharacterized protein n=1 Tax=Crucibulum laeve TaxID=68775 RepID=A0A5C3MCM6_9AGAR|nr:hypothetical protein BDQ12DRAFT_674505 [Crucibulum laeve]
MVESEDEEEGNDNNADMEEHNQSMAVDEAMDVSEPQYSQNLVDDQESHVDIGVEGTSEVKFSQQKLPRTKSKSKAKGKPPKKKARVLSSEAESEEDYIADEPSAEEPLDEDEDEDEFSMDDEKPTKAQNKRKGVKHASSKGHGAKRKVKGESTAAKTTQDKGSFAAESSRGEMAGIKRPRARSVKSEDVPVDVVGDHIPPADSTSQGDAETTSPTKEEDPHPPAKKRRLPTMRKNKGAPNTPSSSKPSPLPTITKSILPDVNKSTPATRKPAATAGNADLDLTNASVYASLFKASAGASSNRRTNEERRKELDKMREDARAKRAEEAKYSFDLQEQTDKIARFEEPMRQVQSYALFPNSLAARWRQDWDERRARDKRGQKHERNSSNTVEEGEMKEALTPVR